MLCSVAVARTPVVVPDNLPCLLMILAVSTCGFAAQVSAASLTNNHSASSYRSL